MYQTGAYGEESYENSVHMITEKNPVIDQVNGFNAFNGEPWAAVAPGTTYNDIPWALQTSARQKTQSHWATNRDTRAGS